jgi:anti-sigma-K factor RskA
VALWLPPVLVSLVALSLMAVLLLVAGALGPAFGADPPEQPVVATLATASAASALVSAREGTRRFRAVLVMTTMFRRRCRRPVRVMSPSLDNLVLITVTQP